MNIQAVNSARQAITGSSKIGLFLYKNLIIEYFNQITIKGLSIMPAIDANFFAELDNGN